MVNELKLVAMKENTKKALRFVEERLEQMDAPFSAKVAMATAVEEIFLNIAYYAYGEGQGNATIIMKTEDDTCAIALTFIDQGMEFNPLVKEAPDVSVPIMERRIGGFGIFLVKDRMDQVTYSREDGENRLTISYHWEKSKTE